MVSARKSPIVTPIASFIEDTSASAANRRGEEILGFPVIVGKTWCVTAIISPAEAKQILLAMPKQRPLRSQDVLLFKDLILAGRFKQTHQGLAFDRAGTLIDGQHRLNGAVEADAAIEVQVTFNMDRDLFDCMDRGRVRSLVDDLITTARTDSKNVSQILTGAAKIIHLLDCGWSPRTPFARGAFSINDVVAVMENHPLVTEASEFCEKGRHRFRGLGGGVAAAFLTKFMEINRDAALNFFDDIMGGELCVSGDPGYEMREYLRNRKRVDRGETMVALVRCWNAYIENRKLSKLYTEVKGSITFPVISKGKALSRK